jgi:hypothetical protein
MLYATGSAGLATLVRGSSRRIKIMRFRPANIRLINRRSNLPRLQLALFSQDGENNNNDKNNPTDVQGLTGSLHISAYLKGAVAPFSPCVINIATCLIKIQENLWVNESLAGRLQCR